MKVSKIYIVLLFSFFCTYNVVPQNSSDNLIITELLNNIFSEEYILWNYVKVDSVENVFNFNKDGDINDPYGTLDDCIVFTAAEKGSPYLKNGIVGIFKNSQIIWYSDFIKSKKINSAGIYAITDITNDGTAEIITGWSIQYGSRYSYINLYIYSWDGNQGNIKVSSFNDGFSSVSSHEYKGFNYVDFEGDGVWEIISYDADSELRDIPKVNSYDGMVYSLSETIQIDSINMFFPRNNFNAIVKMKVFYKNDDTLFFNYQIYNEASSGQFINTFDVYSGLDSVTGVTAPNGWIGDSRHKGIAWWDSTNYCCFTTKYKIKPGNTLSGFSYQTNGLPIIVDAYLRGYNYQWQGDYINNTRVNDYLNNSVIIKTIAAKLPPSPFVPFDFLDTLGSYNNQSYDLGWIQTQETRDKYNNHFNNAKNYLQQNNNSAAQSELQLVLNECNADSSTVLSSEAYALLYFNTEYLIEQIPDTEPGLPVKLQDSQGNLLQGGSLQYYDGSWMDAVNNGNGTFNVITERTTVSIRMTYEGGNQQFNNVVVGPDTVAFQTVNSTVKLLNSQNELLPEGEVQFYAGSWREFGTIVNGTASKELLPRQYSFRMTHGGANNDKQQNIGTDPVVVFQTVNSTVQLLDSQGNLITEEGTVQYYAGSWREFGTTSSGTVSKELLPKNYSFRMTHEGVSNDKQQDIGVEDTVSFSTVLCVVQVKDAQNQPVDGAEVKYYSGSWRDIGITENGEVSKELLPKNLSFRIIFNGVTQNKQQDIGSNNIVEFVVE